MAENKVTGVITPILIGYIIITPSITGGVPRCVESVWISSRLCHIFFHRTGVFLGWMGVTLRKNEHLTPENKPSPKEK